MGDRGNIVVIQDEGRTSPIYIYTHYHGQELPSILQQALVLGKDRWNDEPYLTRVIASQVFKQVGIDKILGAGLTTYLTDNSYPLLVVDSSRQTVSVMDEKMTKTFHVCAFEEFIILEDPDIRTSGEE